MIRDALKRLSLLHKAKVAFIQDAGNAGAEKQIISKTANGWMK
jgi:hypothetical protein